MTVKDKQKEHKEMSAYLRQRDNDRMKRINYAFTLPRTQKWKAVIDIYLDETPGLREVRDGNIKLAREAREKLGIFNKKAMTGDMQMGMIMPPAYWTIIETCDPEFRDIMSDDTKGRTDNRQAQIKMFKLLMKTFPAFAVPQGEL